MSKQRDNCQTCLAPMLRVWIQGKPVVLDWPHCPTGDVAVEKALNGTFFAAFVPVGVALSPVQKRYRRHDCASVPPDQVERWKKAVADHNAAKRNQRRRRPAAAITGYRINPQ